MYVAKSRQVAPENAFSRRRRAQAAADAAKAAPVPAKLPEPAEVAEQMPDLDALREAAARAAALVHDETRQSPDPVGSPPYPPKPNGPSVPSGEAAESADKRGRPASSAVAERTARILELITRAGAEGISKPDLAAAVGTKDANVQVALGKLKDAGKVESRRLPDTGKYRWFAV